MDIKELIKIKDEGNQLYKNKSYKQSISKFTKCIQRIQQQNKKDFIHKDTEISKLYVICLNNAAMACINQKTIDKYEQAIQFCDKSLSIDPQNMKGLYRRGFARKQMAYKIQKQQGINTTGLLQLYEQANHDFQQLSLLEKDDDIGKNNFQIVTKDIYRVKVERGEQVKFNAQPNKVNPPKQLKIANQQKIPKKKGYDWNKLMKEYKVEQSASAIQQKVRLQYLTNQLPINKTQLQKAIKILQKSQDIFIKFVYRINQEYLNKIQPSFDLLIPLTSIIVKKGSGEQAKLTTVAIQKQKSFKLLWKSYTGKEKDVFQTKLKELGLPEYQLLN